LISLTGKIVKSFGRSLNPGSWR